MKFCIYVLALVYHRAPHHCSGTEQLAASSSLADSSCIQRQHKHAAEILSANERSRCPADSNFLLRQLKASGGSLPIAANLPANGRLPSEAEYMNLYEPLAGSGLLPPETWN